MKKFLTLLIFTFAISSSYSQDRQLISHHRDSILQQQLQNRYYQDTLWVCDSIIHAAGDGERYGKQEVLNRNELGNETALKYTMLFSPSGNYDYPYIDSTCYFSDNENVERKTHWVNIASSGSWETSQLFHYHSPEVIMEMFYKDYSYSTQSFDGGGHKEYYVFNNNKPDTLFLYYLPDNSQWQNQSFCKFHYDESGNDTLQVNYNWTNNSYVTSSKHRRVYSSGNLVHWYTLEWDSTNAIWQNKAHVYYSYNASNLEDTIINQIWDEGENNWRDEVKSQITYDENQRVITYLHKLYDYSTLQLENYILITNIYENNNQTVLDKRWENNEWINYSQIFYSYIDEVRTDTIISMNWDISSGNWIPESQSITNYDSQMNAKQYLRQKYTDNQWETIKTYDYYWSSFGPNAVFETNDVVTLFVYPNPASTQVSFVLPEELLHHNKEVLIRIFNLSGQKIDEVSLTKDKISWDCTAVKPGLYVYTTVVNDISYSGKFIVK